MFKNAKNPKKNAGRLSAEENIKKITLKNENNIILCILYNFEGSL